MARHVTLLSEDLIFYLNVHVTMYMFCVKKYNLFILCLTVYEANVTRSLR
jgi:hypothetical protein